MLWGISPAMMAGSALTVSLSVMAAGDLDSGVFL